jgi:hypothetical protein
MAVIHPRSLDVSGLKTTLPTTRFEAFEDRYFAGISGYNALMLSPCFYERFADSTYILIHQLDAYVFRDELEYWCAQGYDYIGAPWLVRPVYRFPLFRLASWLKKQYCLATGTPNGQITRYRVGNGGFSLRKVSSHLKATRDLSKVIEFYLAHKHNHIFHEDVFFAVEVNRHQMGFHYPHYMEALKFSFDKYPALCFRLNGNQLPFGCHSWYGRKMKRFWFPLILKQTLPTTS